MDFTVPRVPLRIAAMNASSSSVEMISAMPSRPRGKIPELFLDRLLQEFEIGAGVYVWKLPSQEPGSIPLPHRGRGRQFELRRCRRAAGEESGEARAESRQFELRRCRRAAGEESGEARAESREGA